jgi:hypothetical protein
MNKISKLTLKVVLALNIVCFTLLMLINIYGLFQTLRPPSFEEHQLRFKSNDISLTHQEFLDAIHKADDESNVEYANRLTTTVAQGMAHIHWEKYQPEKFNQTVPIWENYILYFMGKLRVTPEYVRYHFSNPYKSIERGIGICGDASMLMSQMLEKYNIPNKIVTIPGHVMVQAEFAEGKPLFDPDFGVTLPKSADYYGKNPEHINTAYSDAGHSIHDDNFIINGFKKKHAYWNGIKHFITKKYYFEKVAYVMKWLLPVLMFILSIGVWRKYLKENSSHV